VLSNEPKMIIVRCS